jgi:hypothetical protein
MPIAKSTNCKHTLVNWFANSSTQSFTKRHLTLYKEHHKIWSLLEGSGCLSSHNIEHRLAHVSAELDWLAHRWFRLGSPFFGTNPPENSKRTNGLLCRNTILCPSVSYGVLYQCIKRRLREEVHGLRREGAFPRAVRCEECVHLDRVQYDCSGDRINDP